MRGHIRDLKIELGNVVSPDRGFRRDAIFEMRELDIGSHLLDSFPSQLRFSFWLRGVDGNESLSIPYLDTARIPGPFVGGLEIGFCFFVARPVILPL